MPYTENCARVDEPRQEPNAKDVATDTNRVLMETKLMLECLAEFITGEKIAQSEKDPQPGALMFAMMQNLDIASKNMYLVKAIMQKLGAQ